jgi:membrane associated rhomboid family serine protease
VIPLRALLLRRTTPVVTLVLIAINVLCFLIEISQPPYLQGAFLERYALVPDHFHVSALVTSMFLHGGWLHLIGNMWFLWVFGGHVEEAVGGPKYIVFYLVSGIVSALIQLGVNLGSPIPTLGASGAIAGVMGGFMLLYPRARVVTLVFIIIFITTIELPAAFMLLYWFAIQLLSGLQSVRSFTDSGGVAWFAHVGGFLAGLVLIRVFAGTGRGRPRYSY